MKYRIRNAHRNFDELFEWLSNAKLKAELVYCQPRGKWPKDNLNWRHSTSGTFIDLYEGETFTGYWVEVVS